MHPKAMTFAAILALSACATTMAPAHPTGARLTNDTLIIELSDNGRCRTGWAQGSGRIEGCAGGMDWQVIPDPRPNPLRYVWAEFFKAMGGASIVPPMATIQLTDASGRSYRFRSPERLAHSDRDRHD